MTFNSITPNQASSLITGMISAFNSDLDMFIDEFKHNQSEMLNMVVSVMSKASGGNVLPSFDFDTYFELTSIMMADPKQARPMDRSIGELSREDKTELLKMLNEHIINYTNQMLAEESNRSLKENYVQYQARHAQAPQAVSVVNTVASSTSSSRTSTQSQIPATTQPRLNIQLQPEVDIYRNWWHRLSRAHKQILIKQYQELSNTERQIISAQINPELRVNPDLIQKACYYNFYFNYLSNHYRDNTINLDTIIINNRTRLAARVSNQAQANQYVDSSYISLQLSRNELRQQLLEQRIRRLESRDYYFGDMLEYIYFRRMYMSYFMSSPTHIHHYDSKPANSKQDNKKEESDKSAMAALLMVIALLALSAASTIYAIIKTTKSINNIANNRKLPRSLGRLAASVICAFITAIILLAVGTPMTIITATGMSIVMAVSSTIGLGMLLGSGIGIFVCKYTNQLISKSTNSNEICPTNPEKYKLSASQQDYFVNLGVNFDELNRLIKDLKAVKDELGFSRKFYWCDAYSENNLYNKILEQIKNGAFLGTVIFNGDRYRLFHDFATNFNLNPVETVTEQRSHIPATQTSGMHAGFGWAGLQATTRSPIHNTTARDAARLPAGIAF